VTAVAPTSRHRIACGAVLTALLAGLVLAMAPVGSASAPGGDLAESAYQRCRNSVRTGSALPIGPPAAIGTSLKMLITHTDVITTSRSQFLRQRDAYLAAGIGPWSRPTQNAFWAEYCGRRVLLKRHILLTTNTDETYLESGVSYFEVMRDVSDAPTFFNDYAATHPEGLVYQGMVPADPTMTLDALLSALERQQVPVLMHWPQPGPGGLTLHTLIVRIGGVYAEIVYVPGIT
jgi:hypothetical protein